MNIEMTCPVYYKVKNTFVEELEENMSPEECTGRPAQPQSFPIYLPSDREARMEEEAPIKEVPAEKEEAPAPLADPVAPALAAAPGPPTVQGVAPDMLAGVPPFGGGGYALGTGQGYDGVHAWPWGQPPVTVCPPLVVEQSMVDYVKVDLHDYQDSFGLQDPYQDLDNTNEATPFEEHIRLQKDYKEQAQLTLTQVEMRLAWVKKLEEELERRRGVDASGGDGAKQTSEGSALGEPLPLMRALSANSTPSVPPPPGLLDTKSKSEPHSMLRAGVPAYVHPNHGAYSFPPSGKCSKSDDFDRRVDGGSQTPDTASLPSSATTSASSTTTLGGRLFGSLIDTDNRVPEPSSMGVGHSDSPETDDMWFLPKATAGSAVPPLLQAPPVAPPAAAASTRAAPSPAAPAEVSPEEAAQQYSFSVAEAKFNQTGKSIVSKPFSVLMNGVAVPFLVQITASKIEDKKGGHSFKKAKGHGKLEVNCKKPPANGVLTSISFVVGSQTRGPVHHNFAESSLCGLPKDEEEWHFLSAVDPATSTVTICVKIPGHKVVSSS